MKVVNLDTETSTKITQDNINVVFSIYHKELLEKAKMVCNIYYNGDTWYSYKDLYQDSYIKLLTNSRNWNIEFDSLDHFMGTYVNSLKKLYVSYTRTVRRRHKRNSVWLDLNYSKVGHEVVDEILGVYSYNDIDLTFLKLHLDKCTLDDKFILECKLRKKPNSYISSKLNCSNGTLRGKVLRARIRFFNYLKVVGVIPSHIEYKDLPKYSKYEETKYEIGDEYLINNYPFEGDTNEKVRSIIQNFPGSKASKIYSIFKKNHTGISKLHTNNLRKIVSHQLQKLFKEKEITFIDGGAYFLDC